jgi:hypothetical protein
MLQFGLGPHYGMAPDHDDWRAIQAAVENIPWNHTLLAQVSIASVVCVVLAVKA